MSTEYTLNLKAVLNTQQVQAELQKLRNQQQAILGNNQSNKGGTGGLNNFGSLTNTLNLLNQSINQLNTTLKQFGISAKSNNSTSLNRYIGNNKSFESFIIANNIGGSLQKSGSFVGDFVTDIDKAYNDALSKVQQMGKNKLISNALRITKNGIDLSKSKEDIQRVYNDLKNSDSSFSKALNNKLDNDYIKPFKGKYPNPLQYALQNPSVLKQIKSVNNPNAEKYRQGAGFLIMGAGQVLNSAANWAGATGHTGVEKTLTTTSGLAQMTGTGAMIGSVIPGVGTLAGMGVGLVIGGIKATFDYLAESAKEAADSLKALTGTMKDAKSNVVSMGLYNENRQIKQDLEKGSTASLKKYLSSTQEQLANNAIVQLGGEKEYINVVNSLKRKSDSARENGNVEYANELTEQINTLNNDFKEYSTLKQRRDNLSDQLLSFEKTNLQNLLSKLVAPNMDNVNSLASQGLMINRADDTSREQSLIDYQKEQTDLQRQIRDLVKDSGTLQ